MLTRVSLNLIGLLLIMPPQHTCSQEKSDPHPYLFEHFDTNDGLPSNFSNSVVQDSLGFLWFLHDNALSRYDGYRFKIYWHDSTDQMRLIGSSRDGMLVLDNSKNVWVVSQQIKHSNIKLTLSRYDRRRDVFIKYFPDTQKARITHVCFEKNNSIVWMGTAGRGLMSFNTVTGETTQYLNGGNKGANDVNFFIFLLDRDSTLLLASWKGLWSFRKDTHVFTRPPTNVKDSSMLYQSSMVFMLPARDEPDQLWLVSVGAQHKFIKVDKELTIVHLKTLAPLDGEVLVSDSNGALWFTTQTQGFFCYDPRDSTLSQFKADPQDQRGLTSNLLRGLAIDKEENMWITSYDRGITKLKRPNPVFYNYHFNGEITARTIYSMNDHDYLILAVSKPEEGGSEIAIASIGNEPLSELSFQTFPLRTRSGSALSRIDRLEKGKHKLWIASSNGELFSLPITKSGTVQPGPLNNLAIPPGDSNILNSENITGLFEDGLNNLWIARYGNGLNKVNLSMQTGDTGSIVHYKNIPSDYRSPSSDIIWKMYPKDSTSFYLVTATGVDVYDGKAFQHYFYDNNTMTVRTDSKGSILIGTSRGLYESTDASGQRFRKTPSIALSKYGVLALEEDTKGRVWITNDHGLICYERKESNIMIFTKADGLYYSREWMGRTSGGIVITSDSRGVTLFDPSSLVTHHKEAPVVFTDITVNNLTPRIAQGRSAGDSFSIAMDVTLLSELLLDHRNNDFSITFSAMEMLSPKNNLYNHKLEGYDHSWIETDLSNRTATYTNLDAGEYTLRVKASNYHGIWNKNEKRLTVIVAPAPWKTWWAYSIYGAILLALIISWRRYDLRRLRLRHQARKLRELDAIKTRFFTNISHEFRTPITLIMGPLQELLNQQTSSDHKALIEMMMRNARRLLRLINQLLDLSKFDAGKMTLQRQQVEVVQMLREIMSYYEPLATGKNINYTFNSDVTTLYAFLDAEKIEKAINNILSNAFKFSHSGGSVQVVLRQEHNSAVIVITDTGIGIAEHHGAKIFSRFYQAHSSHTGYGGTGIGLTLAKEMVELHHGSIDFESCEGQGTSFRITIPLITTTTKGTAVLFKKSQPDDDPLVLLDDPQMPAGDEAGVSHNSGPRVLIVEDNADMRKYLQRILMKSYQIELAENGQIGLFKAKKEAPDLVISDIMMPEMDGCKLCELLKTNELTSHIPVLLLTAKADPASKIIGLETGADDYIEKPFNTEELLLIVRNRIAQRTNMRERFSRSITLEPKQIAITSLDEKFLQKVLGIIEKHIDEERFSIAELSEEVGYSQIQFYRKIKALSGQAPRQFLRTIRLKRASDMLTKKSDHIAQIAYSVGFSSESYFIKCFKDQFGLTPGQFAEYQSQKTADNPKKPQHTN